MRIPERGDAGRGNHLTLISGTRGGGGGEREGEVVNGEGENNMTEQVCSNKREGKKVELYMMK